MLTSADFVDALLEKIFESKMLPKVQLERALSPIFELFIESALATFFGRRLTLLCSEFPVRTFRITRDVKPKKDEVQNDNMSSFNVDWVLLDHDKSAPRLMFVELKTSDNSFRVNQADNYRELEKQIPAAIEDILVNDLNKIAQNSSESGKYTYVIEKIYQHLIFAGVKASDIRSCEMIYIGPSSAKRSSWEDSYPGWKWISFGDLPASFDHPYSSVWPKLLSRLVELDTNTRDSRNGKRSDIPDIVRSKNYEDIVTLDQLVELCREKGDSIVVGFTGGPAAVWRATDEELDIRPFKWDFAEGGQGTKTPGNWLPGDQFLKLLEGRQSASVATS